MIVIITLTIGGPVHTTNGPIIIGGREIFVIITFTINGPIPTTDGPVNIGGWRMAVSSIATVGGFIPADGLSSRGGQSLVVIVNSSIDGADRLIMTVDRSMFILWCFTKVKNMQRRMVMRTARFILHLAIFGGEIITDTAS